MKVILSKDAHKQYIHLPKPDQIKILKKLTSLESSPNEGKKLSGELHGILSLHAWPYRILYEINEKQQLITIHKIAHRQGVYK
jgi:mRNA-degrading endonuclease RelE of RelBE toxin-antitoxin system